MKTKLLSLAVAVLGIPILAHAVTPPIPPDGFPPDGLCAHAAQLVVSFLALLGLC